MMTTSVSTPILQRPYLTYVSEVIGSKVSQYVSCISFYRPVEKEKSFLFSENVITNNHGVKVYLVCGSHSGNSNKFSYCIH